MTAVGGVRGRLLIGGEWRPGTGPPLEVFDKYTGALIGTVDGAGREQVDAAVAAARHSSAQHPLDPQERYLRLQATARLIEQHRDELAALITAEGGLPITDAVAVELPGGGAGTSLGNGVTGSTGVGVAGALDALASFDRFSSSISLMKPSISLRSEAGNTVALRR
jgi:hypothetical protein